MTDEPVNTEETAADAARRYATELHRLETGLRDRGIQPAPGTPVDSWAVDLALDTIDRLMPDDDLRHVIDLRADGWTIKHPISCRLSRDLFECPINRAAERDLTEPAQLGRFECDIDDGGWLVIDYGGEASP